MTTPNDFRRMSDDALAEWHVLVTTVDSQKAALDAAAGRMADLMMHREELTAENARLRDQIEHGIHRASAVEAQYARQFNELTRRFLLVFACLHQLVTLHDEHPQGNECEKYFDKWFNAFDGAKAALKETGELIQ